MERSDSVSAPRHALAVFGMLLLVAALPTAANGKLVLVVSTNSPVQHLDSLQVRKLFLGQTVTHAGTRLHPLLNETDGQIKAVFLQNVVSMSDLSYDRHLLGQALKQGRSQPAIFKTSAMLFTALAADPDAISYAWLKDVERQPRLRILRVLWHD